MNAALRTRRFEIFAYIVLILLGIGVVVIAHQFLTRSSLLLQVVIGVGTESIIVGALFFYYRILLIDPASQLEEIVDQIALLKSGMLAGLEELYVTRDMVPREEWMALIEGAKREVGILAVAMQQYVAQARFPDIVSDLNRKGVSCRIMLVHPESDDVKQRFVMDKPLFFDRVDTYIIRSIRRLKLSLNGLGIVRLHYLAHTCDVVWADDTMYVAHYLAGGPGGTSPCIKLIRKQGGLFERYRQHFDALWDDGKTVRLEDYAERE